jgi:NAD(P)-dependent dehydrogenase (short-subunit alcohol dehydrogenase family)
MEQNAFRLDGQLALVTGGGTGLGFGISQALVGAGARVVLVSRTEESLKRACNQLGKAASHIPHDVRNLESLPGLVAQVEDRFGPLDILANNAGNYLKKPAIETTDDELMNLFHTHFFSSYVLSRECGRRMMERKRGSIVMTVSMTALFGIPLVSVYGAAKSALLGLTRALAVEFSPHGVRVNAIAPGWFNTELNRQAFEKDPARLQKILARTPLGRVGEPLDVGYAATYLCSPAAKFVTGIVLPVDGGASIGF